MRVRRRPDLFQTVSRFDVWTHEPLDDAWDLEWRVEHRWHTRHPWGVPQVPPRPAGWRPGESTEEAWLRRVVGERGRAMAMRELVREVYGLP